MGKLGELVRRGVGAPIRALMPRNPWLRLLVFAIPVLLLAAFLEPVLSLLSRGLELILDTFTPLLDNPIGRLILLNLILIVVIGSVWYFLRERWRTLRSGLVLRHHLQGVSTLVVDPPRSRSLLKKVATSRAEPPREYPAAREDAMLKLARLAGDEGDHDTALAWLTRVREKGLPKELQRSLTQLRAEAAVRQGQVLDESVERELRAGLDRFGDDLVMLRLLRDLLVARGDWEEVATTQGRIASSAPPSRALAERERWVEDLVRAGEDALARGDHKAAMRYGRKAKSAQPGPTAGCFLGRVFEADGDLKRATREWAQTESPEGLDLMAALLDQHPGALSPRELLECSPTEGTLLLVAREYARAGETTKALRAARRAAKALGPIPAVAAVLSEVLERCGQAEEAGRLREAAVRQLLAPADAAG